MILTCGFALTWVCQVSCEESMSVMRLRILILLIILAFIRSICTISTYFIAKMGFLRLPSGRRGHKTLRFEVEFASSLGESF